MSVQLPRRKPGKLKVETLAVEVCRQTRKLLTDEKLFPKRSHWLGVRDIADASMKMLDCIFAANDVRVKTAEDARERHRLQTLALAYFGTLEKRMTFEAFYWENDPNLYELWARTMNELGETLSKWKYRDDQRYAALLGLDEPGA